jgi:penicillin-binding protein 1A
MPSTAQRRPPAAPSRPAGRARRQAPGFWRRHHRLVRALALAATFAAAAGFGGLYAAWALVCRGGACPSVETLAGYTPRQTSKVYAADGRFVAEIGNERRTLVAVKDIPPVVREAFLVTEDKRFRSHRGIDWLRVPGAVLRNVRARRWREGFSTITMQLARNVFTEDISREKTLVRKLREAKVARDIERRYSKDQILELYLNQIYLGAGAYGVETAAQRYFGKSVRDLNLAEAATLAALPKGPERYNPRRFPDRAVQRRNTVVELMRREGVVTDADASLAKAYPLQLASRQESGEQAPYYVEWVRQLMETKFGRQLYEDGLKVYTTLDPDMQSAAERALEAQLRAIEAGRFGAYKHPTYEQYVGRSAGDEETHVGASSPYLQGAFVALDPRTGAVRALVGGRDFDDSKFNRATQALRQPGSSFKPVVYSAAVQAGRMPSSPVTDEPVTIGDWTPKNFDGKFMGSIPMRRALYLSRNLAMVNLGQELGPQAVAAEARKFGISSPIPNYPSIYLGAASVYPVEMIAAYSAFATLGTRAAPYAITRVEDRDGRVLWQPEPVRAPVLSAEEAYLMVSMMKDVNMRGTAYNAVWDAGFHVPSAGKTGTTNDGADAWYIGYTPDLVAGVWVGLDRPRQIKGNAQGGDLAAPAWTAFMTEVYRRKPAPPDWPQPAGVVGVQLVAGTNLLYIPECVGAPVVTELFIAGLEPVESCTPGVFYGPPGTNPADSLAADSLAATYAGPYAAPPSPAGDPTPPGRRATVPFGDPASEPPPAARRRPAGPPRDTLFEQTAPPGARPTVPPLRR